MTKIFDGALKDAKELTKQSATRNDFNSQIENAKQMESSDITARELVSRYYQNTAKQVATNALKATGVTPEMFSQAEETTKCFVCVFTECTEESAQKQGLTDTLEVGTHKFYIKNQDVNDAFDIVRSFESYLKVAKAKEVEHRKVAAATKKVDTTLAAAAAILGVSIDELKKLKHLE